jgi:hypothetical protein
MASDGDKSAGRDPGLLAESSVVTRLVIVARDPHTYRPRRVASAPRSVTDAPG